MHDALAPGSGFKVEIINHHRDGSAYWAGVEVTPVRDADGRLTRFIGIQSDISERKRHEVELLRALVAERDMNAEQRRFVAMASHEFRTPLALIDGAVQRILARMPEADPGIGKRLRRIRTSATQLTQLIERTLSSARLDAGRLELQPCSVDLAALVREICNRQRTLTPEFGLGLALLAIPDPIEGDPKLLEQVFSNLVSNAIKYSGSSRGIGLHLVKELVTMHGGQVGVESELGHGSLFRVVLPRRLPVAQARELGSE